jgi:hypothetical protein
LATIFFSYSHADEGLRDHLEKHLSMLKRQAVISTWHDRRISAGSNLDHSISRELELADVILLLVSPDFLASNYCYDVEMVRAMERHALGECRVIPVILRHCDWHGAPFGNLLATPKDGKPVKSFPDLDEAFLQVEQAIKAAVASRVASPIPPPNSRRNSTDPIRVSQSQASGPRSSNLRLKKSFTDADIDTYQDEVFEYISRFFENSLSEVEVRNPGVQGKFQKVDARQFTATIYRGGARQSYCRVFMGSRSFANGIAYSSNETMGGDSFNESLSVKADNEGLFLRALGMAMHAPKEKKLTMEGAAEFYWDMFIEPLRR